jgi:hypothetical protein
MLVNDTHSSLVHLPVSNKDKKVLYQDKENKLECLYPEMFANDIHSSLVHLTIGYKDQNFSNINILKIS